MRNETASKPPFVVDGRTGSGEAEPRGGERRKNAAAVRRNPRRKKKQGKPAMAKKKQSNEAKAEVNQAAHRALRPQGQDRATIRPWGWSLRRPIPIRKRRRPTSTIPTSILSLSGQARPSGAASRFPRSRSTSTSGLIRGRSSGPCRSGTAKAPASPGKLVQRSLFEEPEENPPLREAIDFYRHAHGWSNRLIAGDSLLVMNSLLEKEGMAGKVQMVYIDPPYGIKYGSNFQPFVNQRDVKDGKDQDLTQEPEMIQAFRDTWELGIHSYLQCLRDRLLLARELLSESGICFVADRRSRTFILSVMCWTRYLEGQIFCDDFDLLRRLVDNQDAACREPLDFILWYAKSMSKCKFAPVFSRRRTIGGAGAVKLHSGGTIGWYAIDRLTH